MHKLISVIIPTLNEDNLKNLVEKIKRNSAKKVEIIIVDASIPRISIKGVKIIRSEKGRAKQMNAGAKLAKGNILLFLHADTFLPKNWDANIEYAINKGYDWGGFQRTFKSNSFLRAIAFLKDIHAQLSHSLFGDNVIFIKKAIFNKIGGYKEIDLMEDVEISKKLRNYRFKMIPRKVITSARRFENGTIKTVLKMAYLRFLYELGFQPSKLARMYEKI